MKIVVCIKQVPDTNEVRVNPLTGQLIREGVPSIINPDDKNALEAALQLKDAHSDVKVIVLTMGPPQADVALREALAMGADEAILVTGREFGGSDTFATSQIIAAAIRKIGDYDIILCGRQAIDGDTAQVGPQIAEKLSIPQITYVQDLKIDGKTVICQRALEDGYMTIQAQTPCLLTAIKELNVPRYMHARGIFDAYEKEIPVWGYADLENDPAIDKATIGLKGSPTNVFKSFTPAPKGAGTILEGADRNTVNTLVSILQEKHIL